MTERFAVDTSAVVDLMRADRTADRGFDHIEGLTVNALVTFEIE